MPPRCNTEFKAVHHSGKRNASVKYVVIHSTESPNQDSSARNVAHYFATPKNDDLPPSTHLVLDDDGCYRTLPDNLIPWGAPPFNSQGVHIEQCGYAKWARATWLKHAKTIELCALWTAHYCINFDIPPVWLSPAKCKERRPGITSHRNVAIAFSLTDHSDPGNPKDNKFYPYDYFMRKVKTEFYRLKG